MKIMKPISASEIPTNENKFVYEVKYDGFRAILNWTHEGVKLISQHNRDLTNEFPEIVEYCNKNSQIMNEHLPLTLDGEIVILNNDYQANFSLLQSRGRMKNKTVIQKKSKIRPATFMAFDVLLLADLNVTEDVYIHRKEKLKKVLRILESNTFKRINYIPFFEQPYHIWDIVFKHKSEGIIAKRKRSKYSHGKKHRDWFKIKNWRRVQGFLTSYDYKNEYFTVSVYHNGDVINIGKCKHGLDKETFSTLKNLFTTQGEKKKNSYTLPPAICANIFTLDLLGGELREPQFSQLLPKAGPEDCTLQQLNIDLAMLPPRIELSNIEKAFWNEKNLTKGDLLVFIREISPYMLPYLQEKALTVIRSPDGVKGKSFFQKSLPTYAPSYIKSVSKKDKDLIICDQLESLIWLANHGAIEYHIPFQTVFSKHPSEIAFDLDPPSRKDFKLAVLAAKLIKKMLDHLELTSFVKTSGNKGLQIHVPIPEKSMSYHDTALFTEAIATTLVNEYPDVFTIERLKKNRKNRLYIDYVQHGKDKTLIAPYSPRKTNEATVATPLFWEEVKDDLTPDLFTITNVIERVQSLGCPFANYDDIGRQQKLDKLWSLIK